MSRMLIKILLDTNVHWWHSEHSIRRLKGCLLGINNTMVVVTE
jgi:hypothetical protein